MRIKWLAVVVASVAVCASAPAFAVGAPAHTTAASLSLAWETPDQQRILVSWPDAAVTRVVLQRADGTAEREYDAGPNFSLSIDTADLSTGGVWRFASYAGQDLIARTGLFDSDPAVPAVITGVTTGPGLLSISFRVGRVADSTPDDPLDTLWMTVETTLSGCDLELKAAAFDIPSGQAEVNQGVGFRTPVVPSALWMHMGSGFGPRASARGALNKIQLSPRSIPRTGTWSQPLTFTAGVSEFYNGGCEVGEELVRADRVWLQARKSPSDQWQRITPTSAAMVNGTLTVRTPAIGNREYRLYAPSLNTAPNELSLGDATAAVPVTVSTRLLSAQFSDATVTTTQRTTASIWVGPYGSQLATLQYRRSTTAAWAAVVNRKLASGRVSYTFAWNRRGVTYFRWVVAPTTYAGLRVEGKTTGNMVLTVR